MNGHETRQARAPTLSERAFQAQVVALARLLGWTVYHPWVSLHSAAGFPDLVLVRPPRLLFVELKSERGKLTPAQQRWLELLGQVPGVEARLWRPGDWDEIVAALR